MYNFLIKAYKPENRFYITDENKGYLFFYCKGLKDLRSTIRAITPGGIRIRKSQWFANRLKNGFDCLRLNHPLFNTQMFEIKKITAPVNVKHEIEYTNNGARNFTHKLKITDENFGTI